VLRARAVGGAARSVSMTQHGAYLSLDPPHSSLRRGCTERERKGAVSEAGPLVLRRSGARRCGPGARWSSACRAASRWRTARGPSTPRPPRRGLPGAVPRAPAAEEPEPPSQRYGRNHRRRPPAVCNAQCCSVNEIAFLRDNHERGEGTVTSRRNVHWHAGPSFGSGGWTDVASGTRVRT